MILTAELSLYPLNEKYVEAIDGFIAALAKREGLVLTTNAMSTQLQGDYDGVINAVREALRESATRYGDQVLVCKFIPMALPIV